MSTRDVMAALLKMYNYEELARYNSLTSSLIDSFYQNYYDGLGSNNNVLANYSVGWFSKEYQPHGCFPVKMFCTAANGGAPINRLSIYASGVTQAEGPSGPRNHVHRLCTQDMLYSLRVPSFGACTKTDCDTSTT